MALAAVVLSAGPVNVVAPVAFAALASIFFGLAMQVWVASVQIRRFLHWFSGHPDANQNLGRLFDVYGWRARLAVRLFRIQLSPGFEAEVRTRNHGHPVPSAVEALVVGLMMVVLLVAVGAFAYLTAR